MSFAISIKSENQSGNVIRDLWAKAALLEQTPSMESLHYPPHITFAIYEDADVSELAQSVDAAFSGLDCFEIRFESIGYFDTPNSVVLWAAPKATDRLMVAHSAVHSAIDPSLCRPTYRPGTWVPHCSLATSIDRSRREEAIQFANQTIEAFDVVFDLADCVRFLPIEILHERELSRDA